MTATPNGFRALCYNFGRGAYVGQGEKYYFAGSGVLGLGDPVVRATGSASSDANGLGALIVRATTGSYVTGCICGFDPVETDLTINYYNNRAGYVYVVSDPDVLFLVYEAGVGAALSTQNLGQSINSITAANAASNGSSVMAIDNNTVTTASTGTWILKQLYQVPGNTPNGVGTLWVVAPNLHTERSSGATSILAI